MAIPAGELGWTRRCIGVGVGRLQWMDIPDVETLFGIGPVSLSDAVSNSAKASGGVATLGAKVQLIGSAAFRKDVSPADSLRGMRRLGGQEAEKVR
jgi:hypothetical protein